MYIGIQGIELANAVLHTGEAHTIHKCKKIFSV